MAYQIQLRRDTAANWTTNDPTLAQGEVGLETDTDKFKIGDGVTAWTSLDYYGGEIHLTPKTSSTGAEGTMFYDSDDDHVYVATE